MLAEPGLFLTLREVSVLATPAPSLLGLGCVLAKLGLARLVLALPIPPLPALSCVLAELGLFLILNYSFFQFKSSYNIFFLHYNQRLKINKQMRVGPY